ncbi:MAG: phosphatase PAP2 family protein [Chloroflexota bacterium]
MSVPRDRYKADRVGMVRAARYLSDVISPPTIFAATALALGIYERPVWPGVAWGVIYGVTASLLPILFIFYLLQSGRIDDLHMSDTGQRNLPYIVGVSAALIAFAVISLLNGPELLRCLAIYNTTALMLLGLINTRWLISIHATAIAGAWMIITLVFGWVWSLALLPVVILVCWTRLFLKRHTLSQVLAGVALGAGLVLIFRQFGCFVP